VLPENFWLPGAVFVTTLALADVLLIMRFVLRDDGVDFTNLLLGVQILCTISLFEFTLRRIVRSRRAFRQRQTDHSADALHAFMVGDDDTAPAGFRRLFRRDPWDAKSATMVATVHAARGKRDAEINEALRWSKVSGTSDQPTPDPQP
jgi:hypothetical protein